ncbi:TonB-dependent receptor domain-containing protein [Flavobacterium selenitireducens]|uniref:TonB-dependent receptor domain-containing protein n=1 Tax=Flavobacterium selenitireducens TaxID=2722704 RepID=UPI00168BFF3A|nr:TonB-dependent receptor [Flavobacterium selenitireducens]MBD3580900.1 TonB-dependent receptor [Flavobacterium selenitireducens]
MKLFQWLLVAVLSLGFATANAQKVKVSGKITEKTTKQPLEYATVTFLKPGDTKPVAGGITDSKGEYSIEVAQGVYDIRFEFISFKSYELKNQSITKETRLQNVELSEDSQLLNEVVVRAERTTVEIKLDKKVYNVGQDLLVKGGTVSDVLDNIPSVSVDQDGTISLRGNENVRILIDGKPSNAISITDALRLIPADAIEKVEVVTNPSARYDSEGGGGLLNIILKKGKNQGVNGTFIGTVGDPENYGLSGNLNFKSDKINVFTTTGYNYRTSPGNSLTDTRYLNADNSTRSYTNERRENERLNKGYNTTTGFDWYIDKSLTWTNQINLRIFNNNNPETVKFYNYDADRNFTGMTTRFSDEEGKDENFEYSTNITKNFKKEGHKLTLNGQFSINQDNDIANINFGDERTTNIQDQNRNVFMADYVLPIGKDSQFEAGYKGEFNRVLTDYSVGQLDTDTGLYVLDYDFTNKLDYKEKINALYMQYGSKYGKFSYLAGLRWEDSNIDINQLYTQDYNNKHYNNFFPSLFLTYELGDESNVSLSYSRRISRPRGRLLNPFSNYSSNINLFQGNPDLDPAFSNSFDLGYLKRWRKLTFSTSLFVNVTTDSFQFVRRDSGETVDNGDGTSTPVILTTPINLGKEYRAGFEFTLNYSPFKWWKLNSNFNVFRNETQGDYSYVLSNGDAFTEDFDNVAYSWSTRLTSKVNLPYKIDWQTNFNYNGPQTNAQGKSRGVPSMNLGFSKDILKEKGTVALNVQDVFNSRKRINETYLPGRLDSYSEMQWRVRQITLSLTYRFNKAKNERERDRQPRDGEGGGSEEFPG